MFFFVCNLGLSETTEWKPIKRGAVWIISFKSLKNDKRQCFLNLFSERSHQKTLQF